MKNKKISLFLMGLLVATTIFSSLGLGSANTNVWFTQQNLTTDFNAVDAFGLTNVAGNNQTLVSASFYFDVVTGGTGTLTAYLADAGNINGTWDPVTGVSWIQHSNTILVDSAMASFMNNNDWLQFNFPANYSLSSLHNYAIYIVNDGVTTRWRSGASSASQIVFQSGSWGSGSSQAPTCLVLTDDSPTPGPGPTASPSPAPDNISIIITTLVTTNNILLIIAFAIIIVGAILGAKFAGGWGFLAGLTVGVGLDFMFGLIAIWFVVLIGIVDAIALVRGINAARQDNGAA